MGVLKASLTQSHDPSQTPRQEHPPGRRHTRPCRAPVTVTTLSYPPQISQHQHGQQRYNVASWRGRGEPDTLSTGHGPIICGSEISRCDFTTWDSGGEKKKKRGRLLLLPPMLWLLHNTRGGGQVSNPNTQERGEEEEEEESRSRPVP